VSEPSDCPACGSARTRRGGTAIWTVYVIALIVAVPAVLLLHLDAALVAGVLLAVIVLAHLLLGTKVCLDCGAQWRPKL
jgi:hypothetical protein